MLKIWKQTWKPEDGSGAVQDSDGQSSSQETAKPSDVMEVNIRPSKSSISEDVHKGEESSDDRPNKRRKVEGITSNEHFGSNISMKLPELMDLDHFEPSRDISPGVNQLATPEAIVVAAKQNNSTSR